MCNKESEAKMYSKNEAIFDFKKNKKTQNDGKKKTFFFQKIEPGYFFQKVETDQPASRVPIQPI